MLLLFVASLSRYLLLLGFDVGVVVVVVAVVHFNLALIRFFQIFYKELVTIETGAAAVVILFDAVSCG